MFNLKSIKTQLILYLTCLAVSLAIKDKDSAFLLAALLAVVSAMAIETLISYLKTKTLQITESSIITGLIIGYVVSSDEAWWKIVFAAALAILSKYMIRFRGRHIFNPAAFGVFMSTILLGLSTQWKGTYLWYVLIPFGIYFSHRIKKLEIVIGYAAISFVLFAAQAFFQKVPLWNIFGYFSYFYIFVMVIEPKTTPLGSFGKYIFGAGVAAFIFILTEIGARFDVELFSLLVMNATVPLLKKKGHSMKRIPAFLVFLTFFMAASVAYAHPPSDIRITFDPKTKMLQAVIVHNTNNPLNHYIKKVDVGLNGKEIIEHNISREDNNQTQTVSYLIPDAKDSDILSVEAYCSISGKLKKEIAVRGATPKQ